jgi:hypothetical protein
MGSPVKEERAMPVRLRRSAAVAALAGALALGIPATATARPGPDSDRFDRGGRFTLVIRAIGSLLGLWAKDGGNTVPGG